MSRKQSREIYIGGYDKEYFIDSMSNSHIICTLVQIKAKLEVIEELVTLGYNEGVKASYDCLHGDMTSLAKELDSRDNCKEYC